MAIIIASVDQNFAIGTEDGSLLFRIVEDMKFFRRTTLNSTVIMGRKTAESLPTALSDRQNIVLTRNENYQNDQFTIVHSLNEAFEKKMYETVFIIGGAEIYRHALENNYVSEMYLTHVHAASDKENLVYFPQKYLERFSCSKIDEYLNGEESFDIKHYY